MIRPFLLLLLASGAANAQTILGPDVMQSDDYKAGWEAGWNEAVKASMLNRDHFRAQLGKPESYQKSIDRIFSGEKTHTGSVVDDTVNAILDGIDLHVVLPPAGLEKMLSSMKERK